MNHVKSESFSNVIYNFIPKGIHMREYLKMPISSVVYFIANHN